MFCCASTTARPVVVAARKGGAARQQRRRSVQVLRASGNVASNALRAVVDSNNNNNKGRAMRSGVSIGVGVVGRMSVVARAEEMEAGSTTASNDDEVEDIPPWERREIEKKAAMEKGGLPWPAYLGLSAVVCIASVGSCFELTYGNAIFGVVQPDSFAYKPILYWLIGTGFPLTAFLWTKGIAGANEAADLQDKLDGY